MKGVCAKIYMLGSFGQNGIDSLQSGFACFFKYFFCLFVILLVCLLLIVFFPQNQTFVTFRHTGKKVGGLVSSFQATYTYFPLYYFSYLVTLNFIFL